MHATTSLDDLLESTAGRYLAGPVSVSFIVDPTLVGVFIWGRPSADQITTLIQMHERMRPVLAPRTSALVDVRYLEWPDPSAFAAVVGYLAGRGAWLAEYIERLALVRARDGLVGVAGAGFFDVNPPPFAAASFTAFDDALAWLGRADGAPLAAELEALLVDASGTPTLLRRLREHLDARPGALSLSDAAGALATSERSLQRELKSCGTSFRAEQHRAQVRAAQRLLRDLDAPLAEIAIEIGCASLSQFSVLFRRVTGQTPSEWRKRNGAAARARHG